MAGKLSCAIHVRPVCCCDTNWRISLLSLLKSNPGYLRDCCKKRSHSKASWEDTHSKAFLGSASNAIDDVSVDNGFVS